MNRRSRWLTAAFSITLVFISIFGATPGASAQIASTPSPVITLDATQPPVITERAVTATTPAGWESTYFAEYYEYGYSTSATATIPEDEDVNVISVDPITQPVATPLHVLLDISERDPSAKLYLMIRAHLQNSFLSDWSAPLLINDPGAYTVPDPIPTPTPTPVPTPAPTPSPKPTPLPIPPAANCPKLQFVGVRGSGETKKDAGGYGNTVANIKDIIEKKVPGTSSVPIDYQAVKVGFGGVVYLEYYERSMAEGRTVLDDFLTDFIIDCPHTYIIIAGYSQGAQVAGDEFAYLTNAGKKHVAALILIGDPRFNPNQPKVDAGNYNKNLAGIYQIVMPDMRTIDSEWVPNVRSYCEKGDPICNYSKGNGANCLRDLSKCHHVQYVEGPWLKEAANWAIKHWKTLPSL